LAESRGPRAFYVTPAAARTVFVDNGGMKATDFGLTTDEQPMLTENGQDAARRRLIDLSG